LSYVDERFRSITELEVPDRDVVAELNGKPAGQGWREIRVSSRGTGRWPDWIAHPVPLLSKQAIGVLQPALAGACEILPAFGFDDRTYYFLNVLEFLPQAAWSPKFAPTDKNGETAEVGVEIKAPAVPPIFRLEGWLATTFVSDKVAKLSVDARLSGALFVHPVISSGFPWPQGRRDVASGTGFLRPFEG
jgi:hypothetical protein